VATRGDAAAENTMSLRGSIGGCEFGITRRRVGIGVAKKKQQLRRRRRGMNERRAPIDEGEGGLWVGGGVMCSREMWLWELRGVGGRPGGRTWTGNRP
jgi:hypothetical protein